MKLFPKLLVGILLAMLAAYGWVAINPEKAMAFAIDSERARNGVERKTIEVDGETWFYLEGGEDLDNAETILLLHGFGADKENWTRFSGSLTDKYHVIAPDLPGFGETARYYETSYALPAQRERVYDFVEAMGVKQFHIIGNSMGGHLSGLYAHKFPEQILSLAMFDNGGVVAPKNSEMFELMLSGKPSPLLVTSPDDFDRLYEFVTYKQPWIPDFYKQQLAEAAYKNAPFNLEVWKQLFADRYSGLEVVLPDLEMPVMVLWGKEDRVLDVSSVEVMAPLIRNKTIVIMEETGHMPMVERPAASAAHYRAFIEQ